MKGVLVACADYPNGDSHSMQFVHDRNIKYKKNGIPTYVLNFSAKETYAYDGITVLSYSEFEKNAQRFENWVLICHAPNIRKHYIFLKKYKKFFTNVIFFFHGHEIVKINDAYPKDYTFQKKSALKKKMRSVYDNVKIYIWKKFLIKNKNIYLVFVSNSLLNDFLMYSKTSLADYQNKIYIINNSVSEAFALNSYNEEKLHSYDFITIRSNLDSSVYCADLILKLAQQNPKLSFLVIGKGSFFNYYGKPCNIHHLNMQMNQIDLIEYINDSKIALMPTRRDSQGVMSCELATFGIPVITSKLDVCKEMLDGFENVQLMSDTDLLELDLDAELRKRHPNTANNKFSFDNTVKKEIELIEAIL